MTDANDRFASIAGGGLKKRRPTISVAPTPREVATEVDERPADEGRPSAARAATVSGSVRKPDQGQKAQSRSAETGGTRRAAFRMPPDTDSKLRDRVRADESSKVHVILDAIEYVVANQTELNFSAQTSIATKSALFTRPRTATSATASVQTDVTLDAASLGTIDALVEKYGAPTRTAFVLACLGEYLR